MLQHSKHCDLRNQGLKNYSIIFLTENSKIFFWKGMIGIEMYKKLFYHLRLSLSIRSSVRQLGLPSVRVSQNLFHFLQSYHKMLLIKVVWYVLRVKCLHPGSPSHPSQTPAAEAKPRYAYSILKQHGQSFRRQVRLLLGEAKLSYVYSIYKTHGQGLFNCY